VVFVVAIQGTAAVVAEVEAEAEDIVPILPLGREEAGQDTIQDIVGAHELLPTGNFLHRMLAFQWGTYKGPSEFLS